ncbi:multidrug ABC transporter ATP-binding protein, partial [Streptococcus mutans]|nr:multidrug ABC transporter ATP-binding protein [Streptococcus mutans]
KRRIAEIEERLETIEARETEINEAMLTTNDFTQLADLQKELESVQTEQLELLEEWEELSERVEGD